MLPVLAALLSLAQDETIRPILVERCYGCHSARATKVKGGLLLDTPAGLRRVVASGRLLAAIRHTDDLRMPPKEKLAPERIAAFEEWVRRGAPIPGDHWAFRPPRDVKADTLDTLIPAKGPPADKRTLIRRATFDLTGLPPTPEEVEAFLKDDAPAAYERLLDRLLASPHYGERWGRHWLDVARYSDTKGYVQMPEERRYVQSAAYRDWVIRSLNDDMPYDRFLLQQIAADQLPSGGEPAALGFLTVGRRFKNMEHDIIDDRIDTVMRATIGLTVGCARCHDHKFDPIPTQDYYSLYGVFAGARERAVPLGKGTPAFEAELKRRQDALRDAFGSVRKRIETRHRQKRTEYLVAAVQDKLPSEDTFLLINDSILNPLIVRRWQDYIRRKGLDDPVFGAWNAFASGKPPPQTFACPTPTSMLEVAERYGEILADLPDLPPEKVPSGSVLEAEYFLDWSLREELLKLQGRIDRWILEADGAAPHAVVLDEPAAKPGPQVFRRGNPSERGDEVPCRFLECVSSEGRPPFRQDRARLDLALAIVRRDNPLTARVLVNRLWLHHFGEGLVRTPSDFGLRSDPPTHPELLDWLARRFVEGGASTPLGMNWSIKKMHRLLMLSSTYRQSGGMSRRRLDFEELRDAMLAVSGDLDPTVGGRAVDLTTRPFSGRRSVYGLVDRLNLPSVYRVFDFPSPDAHSPRRTTTTTAPQALFLMNSPFVQERAARLAARASGDIRKLYALAYGREPRPAEVEWGLEFVRSQHATNQPGWFRCIWSYGTLGADGEFRPLPFFTGSIWHAGPRNLLISASFQQPEVKNGWPTLSAEGGHPGTETRMAVVRRWVAPAAGRVEIEHKPPATGARVVSSRAGDQVEPGDTIDFIFDGKGSEPFVWAPRIRLREPSGTVRPFDAARDFRGPPPVALDAWGELAQVLLVSNEFAFVD